MMKKNVESYQEIKNCKSLSNRLLKCTRGDNKFLNIIYLNMFVCKKQVVDFIYRKCKFLILLNNFRKKEFLFQL